MSDQKTRNLGRAAIIVLAIGIIVAAIPFVGSLRPSQLANELNQFKKVDVSEFENNSWQVVHVRQSKEWEEGGATHLRPGRAWLVIRDNAGLYRVFGLPTWEGDFLMGLSFWGQFEGFCNDISPYSENHLFDLNAEIRCNDESNDSYFFDHWRWSLDGENATGAIVDLELIRSELQRNELAVFDQRYFLD